MAELVQENLSRAQKQQKVWYDKMLGEEDFSWYWYSTNKLIAQWQGPYMVVWHLGKVNYEVEMKDKREEEDYARQHAEEVACPT